MTKHIDSDILAVLRQFEIAGELSAKKSIHDIRHYPERQLSRLIGFRFERRRYLLLFDNAVGDDESAVLEHLRMDEPSVKGELVRNPLEGNKAYGMPYKGKDVYLFAIESLKRRLDHEVVTRHPEYSRSTIQKYIKAGYVHVNGQSVTQPKADVTADDEISVSPPLLPTHSDESLPIVYIDDNVIVVNKPSGVLTHSKGVMNDEFTVAEFFRRYTTYGLETNRPGIVHRLDRDTSGVMIGARHHEAADMLKAQFANRTVKKTYKAVVDGVPKETQALIDLPIGRDPSAPSTFRVDPSGKPAQTSYKVEKSDARRSLITLFPRTGRTHQLRVHLAYIHAPIHGDKVYGGKKAERLYLHAESLELTIPDAQRLTFHAPLPVDFVSQMGEGSR